MNINRIIGLIENTLAIGLFLSALVCLIIGKEVVGMLNLIIVYLILIRRTILNI